MADHNNDGYYDLHPPAPKKSWVKVVAKEPPSTTPLYDPINPAEEGSISQDTYDDYIPRPDPLVRFAEHEVFEESSLDSEEPENPFYERGNSNQNPFDIFSEGLEYEPSQGEREVASNPFDQLAALAASNTNDNNYSHAENEQNRRHSNNNIQGRFVI